MGGYRGDASVVALLLDNGAKNSNPAFLLAASGEPHVFIEAPVESGKERPTAIPILEGMMDPVSTVKLLLVRGADLETRDEVGQTPLIKAASYGRLDTVKLLLERGTQLEARDRGGNTALLAAACDCAMATIPDTDVVVEFLLEKGARINTQNHGDTAFMIASKGGVLKTNIVKLLLAKGADIHVKNNQRETALMIASRSNVPEVVKLLKQAQAGTR